MLLPIMLGVVLAGGTFHLLRRRPAAETPVLAVGLLVAALIYLALALPTMDSRWLLVEAGGVVLFGAIAWLGRATPWVLAAGWAAHAGWDVALHLDRAQPVVGAWYPLLCIGFDLPVAGYLWRSGQRDSSAR